MDANLSRYDQFGWDYEQFNPIDDDAFAWHLRHAREPGGPILELACVAGRLVVAFAEADLETVGVDLSATMIALAQCRVDTLPPDVKRRVSLHNADMTSFDLKTQFGLIVIADNSFGELRSRTEQVACLRRANDHLLPDARLLVTVRRFDATVFRHNRLQTDWTSPVHDPVTGKSVRRRLDLQLVDDGTIIKGVITYECADTDSQIERVDCPMEKPVLTTPDYLALFAETGFRTEVFSGYRGSGDDGSDPVLCFVGRKRATNRR